MAGRPPCRRGFQCRMTPPRRTRVLAMDIRSQAFGFVVLEGAGQLLDWGKRMIRSSRPGHDPIASLLDEYRPTHIALRRVQSGARRDVPRTRNSLARVRRQARLRSIRVTSVSENQLKAALARFGATTKHKMASLIAERFVELGHALPQPRKCFKPEHPRMMIFDAAILAVIGLASES